jgi:hypothetical protein
LGGLSLFSPGPATALLTVIPSEASTHIVPPPVCVMTRVRNFIADLLRGGTCAKEVKKLADIRFGDKLLKMRAIFKILKQIKEGKSTND